MPISSNSCPQCGAQLPVGKECRTLFDQCLALEFENPTTYGQVHFLTVTCYMLQHNAYSKVAWLQGRAMLSSYIRLGTSPADIRRKMQRELDHNHQGWRITKGEKLAEFDTIPWSRSIADIRIDDVQAYCSDVEAWAKSVLQDTEFILDKNKSHK